MSRIGKIPVKFDPPIVVNLKEETLTVSGPLGLLTLKIPAQIKVEVNQGEIKVGRKEESRLARSLHGLIRKLIANMVAGVKDGWKKELEIQGTGYRAQLEGQNLVLSVGFSHPVRVEKPEGISFKLEEGNKIVVFGPDKGLVGQVAAEIRKIKPPDPYKGKGLRYFGEQIKLKPGKAGKAGAAGEGSFGG